MASYQFRPVPQPLAVFEHLVASQTQTLVIKETGDHFDVKTLDGRPWMNVKPKYPTAHGRKKVYDAAGHHLFDMIKETFHWAWHPTYSIQVESGKKEHMKVKYKWTIANTKAHATFTTARGTPVTLVMEGKWPSQSVDIVDKASGALAARIERKRSDVRQILREVVGQQTYHATVAPNVDTALIVAMCVCLDEKKEDGGNQGVCTVI
ncbi:hypothetical protein N658DRAFT_419377 [Parathielavia hyrcaniae]|uniref:Uncharacterized protein n=1 Tax=Parathielavia hyrcaniae TaxID=113614 RepID=A0AAN6QBI5_9PEZI|nr:hypothetical protein N658DRAFT_419377 [Parathielavia hyrcaniae]